MDLGAAFCPQLRRARHTRLDAGSPARARTSTHAHRAASVVLLQSEYASSRRSVGALCRWPGSAGVSIGRAMGGDRPHDPASSTVMCRCFPTAATRSSLRTTTAMRLTSTSWRLRSRGRRVTRPPANSPRSPAAMATVCHAIADHDGRLPTIGDDDGGLLFPICGRSPDDVRDSLAIAAALLGRPELAPDALPEEAFWMVGGDLHLWPLVEHNTRGSLLPSRLFPESGYAVINSSTSHAVLDVGPHGFMNGGHAHADALSVTLTVRDRPLLIDPGTASYTDHGMRDRFRSTAMHNTLVVDGRPQAFPSGPFHWRTRANGRVEMWRPSSAIAELEIERSRPTERGEHQEDTAFDYVEATHDGYLPLVHCRSTFRLPEDLWLVVDHLIGTGRHRADMYWHFDPAWSMGKTEKSAATLVREDGYATIASTARSFEAFRGDREGLGWCAPRYGRVVPALTLRAVSRGRFATISLYRVDGIGSSSSTGNRNSAGPFRERVSQCCSSRESQ